MKLRRFLALIMTALLVLGLLSGCGANYAGDAVVDQDSMAVGESGSLAKPEESTSTVMPENQKLVRKVWINAETEDLDTLLSEIDQRIAELSGYVEDREVYNGSAYEAYSSRYANLTIRIPAESLDAFVGDVSEVSNITSTNETTENITLSYVATQSRITALETEQTRLLELLAQAQNMDEILQIESRLTEVRTELEEVTSRLRLYDNQVDYGTIYLNLDEVREYTVVEEEPEGFWERIGKGFMESLENMVTILREIVIFLLVSLPYLLPPVIIVGVILLVYKLRKRKKKTPDTPKTPESE